MMERPDGAGSSRGGEHAQCGDRQCFTKQPAPMRANKPGKMALNAALACRPVSRPGRHGVKQQNCLVSRRSEEHTSELQSRENIVCRLLLEKKKKKEIKKHN